MNEIEGELWEDVVGYEGRYEVSNMGRVASVTRREPRRCPHCGEPVHNAVRQGKLMVATPRKRNGRCVNLTLESAQGFIQYSVARLVLTAFVGPPPVKSYACHIDGDSNNDRVENLIWVAEKDFPAWRTKRRMQK